MKANLDCKELRIGNLIDDGVGNYGQVDIVILQILEENPKNTYKPVHLDAPLLDNLGFEKFGEYKIYNKLWRKGWVLSVQKHTSYKEGYVLFIDDDNSESEAPPSVKIKYVHQLQNLIYGLTGEELKVKETA